jgi:hypothetical protein
MADDDDLDQWQQLLDLAELELVGREPAAGDPGWSQREIAAFGAERDRLAERRDDLADARDRHAEQLDSLAFARDQHSSAHDRSPMVGIAGDDPGFADRFLSAEDRDEAVGDRTNARDDRTHSRSDRQRAAHSRELAALAREDLAEKARLERKLTSLKRILASRIVIGQASGQLMERHSLDADRAFKMLVYLAHDSNVEVHVVAARVVALGNQRRLAQERGQQM